MGLLKSYHSKTRTKWKIFVRINLFVWLLLHATFRENIVILMSIMSANDKMKYCTYFHVSPHAHTYNLLSITSVKIANPIGMPYTWLYFNKILHDFRWCHWNSIFFPHQRLSSKCQIAFKVTIYGEKRMDFSKLCTPWEFSTKNINENFMDSMLFWSL